MSWPPINARIRPGTLINCGETIGRLAGPAMRNFAKESAAEAVSGCRRDLRDFQKQTGVERVVVVECGFDRTV